MSDIKAEIELLQDILAVAEEREAAYATRHEDKERWNAAKHAFAERRSFWRSIKEALNAPGEDDPSTVSPASVSTKTTIRDEEVS